jgi:hypothetical protein
MSPSTEPIEELSWSPNGLKLKRIIQSTTSANQINPFDQSNQSNSWKNWLYVPLVPLSILFTFQTTILLIDWVYSHFNWIDNDEAPLLILNLPLLSSWGGVNLTFRIPPWDRLLIWSEMNLTFQFHFRPSRPIRFSHRSVTLSKCSSVWCRLGFASR